ncbi:MAG: beta-lactamase family protein [Flavobacteriaceae bacterium]|jgi:CubicO group peptidase (beta-lactamase class C family)|nr:beta-lactamase family protein [Flavobacteriaceae bacterium]
MNRLALGGILILCLFPFNSCKKADKTETQQKIIDRSLPGYYDIDFQNIFTRQESHSPEDSKIKSKLSDYYTKFWKTRNLSGGLLVARGNNILFEKYRGSANIEKQIPVTAKTPLHIASVSKIITSLAVLKLVEAGKFSLDQKVNSLLPSFPYEEITVRNLLSHRSGLPNYSYLAEDKRYLWDKSKFMTNEDVLNLFSEHKPELSFPPDTHFAYSNSNFAILALIVEKITKNPFPTAVKKMIFDPLEMEHTFVFQKQDSGKVALSYYNNEKPFSFDYLDCVYGDKNVYSTPQDLYRLSEALFAPNFLRKDLLQQMFTPYSNERAGVKNYGLGIRMMIFPNGKKLTYHNGWWHGSNAVFVHLPDEKVTIIAIGNKFSNAVYSAFRTASFFGNYPLKLEDETVEHGDVLGGHSNSEAKSNSN